MSQTPALLCRSPSGILEDEAEAKDVDSRVLRGILGLRMSGEDDSRFVADAVKSHVERKLNERFHTAHQRVVWELLPFSFHVPTPQVTTHTIEKNDDAGRLRS